MRKDTNQIYFFKGDQYVRFSNVAAGVDAGYPKPIAGNWKGLPDSFAEGIDAALWRDSNGKIYFFKNGRFYGTYVRISNVADGVDAGYEDGVPIGLSTAEAEALWRDPALTQLGFPAGDAGRDQLVADLQDDAWHPVGLRRLLHSSIRRPGSPTPVAAGLVIRYAISARPP